MMQRNKPQCQKTYLLTCAPSKDSDQPAHSRSLIRIFTRHILDRQGCKVSSHRQRGLWSICTGRWAGWFQSLLGIHVRGYILYSYYGNETNQGDSTHLDVEFILYIHKYLKWTFSMSENSIILKKDDSQTELIYFYLETLKRVSRKQCRPRSEATEWMSTYKGFE